METMIYNHNNKDGGSSMYGENNNTEDHTLDKDTSGLMLICKTNEVHINNTIKTQFQERTIENEFITLDLSEHFVQPNEMTFEFEPFTQTENISFDITGSGNASDTPVEKKITKNRSKKLSPRTRSFTANDVTSVTPDSEKPALRKQRKSRRNLNENSVKKENPKKKRVGDGSQKVTPKIKKEPTDPTRTNSRGRTTKKNPNANNTERSARSSKSISPTASQFIIQIEKRKPENKEDNLTPSPITEPSEYPTKNRIRKSNTERGTVSPWRQFSITPSTNTAAEMNLKPKSDHRSPEKLTKKEYRKTTAMDLMEVTGDQIRLALDLAFNDLNAEVDSIDVTKSQPDFPIIEAKGSINAKNAEARVRWAVQQRGENAPRTFSKGSSSDFAPEIATSDSSDSSTMIVKPELRRRSGSEVTIRRKSNQPLPEYIEENYNPANTEETDTTPKRHSRVKTENILSHSSSLPLLKDKQQPDKHTITKSQSRPTLTPTSSAIILTKTAQLPEGGDTTAEVIVTAPTLISGTHTIRTSNSTRYIPPLMKTLNKDSLKKDSHPPLPYSTWEDDGALRPPKNKLFGTGGGDKNSRKKGTKTIV